MAKVNAFSLIAIYGVMAFTVIFVSATPQRRFSGVDDLTGQSSQNTGSRRKAINPMTEACLACICQASTNCNLTTRCISNGKYCGPFLISRPYWLDAGQLTLIGDRAERAGAFEDCANDPICSAQTVRTYMQRFQTDCNRDGAIDCDDMGRIHLMGPTDCVNPRVPTTPFFKRFRSCYDKVLQLSSA
ncbi:unnamed protein product [Orchesella dallaii]|uniref:lysozyme n=1 Tax=Orchesella dallaii TaxID=48710 RepID=A0ABP1RX24_9HEXA